MKGIKKKIKHMSRQLRLKREGETRLYGYRTVVLDALHFHGARLANERGSVLLVTVDTVLKMFDGFLTDASNFNRYKPTLSKDGDQWMLLHGENIQEGYVAFGDTPLEAVFEFNQLKIDADAAVN